MLPDISDLYAEWERRQDEQQRRDDEALDLYLEERCEEITECDFCDEGD